MPLPPGKLDPALLARLLAANVIHDQRVAIRPAVGRDVCAIRMDGAYLVAKTDPVTLASDRAGWYVVHVNANDIATVGACPRWFLLTALLPERRTDEALVQRIYDDVQAALAVIECDLVGGHTEITPGLDRPILVGQMFGEVAADRLIDKASVRPSDRILLTRGVPVEGTAIIAREHAGRLAGRFDAKTVDRARRFLDDPGISVLREAQAACAAGRVHAMHDPTEGGVATGLWELAEAAGCGMLVHEDRIALTDPGGAFCAHLGLDPLGTISSGSLIICAPPQNAAAIRAAVEAIGTPCADIGEVRSRSEGRILVRHGRRLPMPTFPQDEITKLNA
jgi:hydrogenase expression/formation protein HypE